MSFELDGNVDLRCIFGVSTAVLKEGILETSLAIFVGLFKVLRLPTLGARLYLQEVSRLVQCWRWGLQVSA